jgi:hypothetical protein
MFNIEYDVKIDDVIAWNQYQFFRVPAFKRRIMVYRYVLLTISALLIITGVLILVGSGYDSFVDVLPIVLGAVALYYSMIYPRRVRSNLKKSVNKIYSQGKSGDIGLHKISFSPEGLHDTTEFEENSAKWQAVQEIIQTDRRLFIMVGPNAAYIIPQRAFNDEATFNKFAQDIRALFQASQTQQPS